MRSLLLPRGQLTFEHLAVMGILNLTTDSFHAASRVSEGELLRRAEAMLEEGVAVLDLGAESTRPGSDPVPADVEEERITQGVRALRKAFPEAVLSVDTYRAPTAHRAMTEGADIINDISALTFDDAMADTAARHKAGLILMHIKGEPKTMQQAPHYEDLMGEVKAFLRRAIDKALAAGCSPASLMLDPGIGFGKSFDHNVELLRRLSELRLDDLPLLVAASRKGFIGKHLGGLPSEERLEGTIAVTCQAVVGGAEMVRVHDVKENLRAARVMELFA